MPAQHYNRVTVTRPRRAPLPRPGEGGYDYPRGRWGATGFPGSTPAAKKTHTQGPTGRRDRQLTARQAQEEWAKLPPRLPSGLPWGPPPRTGHETAPEHRMTPVIGGAPGSQNVRNQIAQRYKAVPSRWRAYRASPNPGKTGATRDGQSQYHPGQKVYGHPDGKPVPGMSSQTGAPPMVVVQSRFVSAEGSQEGYAMIRRALFAKGGTPAPVPPGAAPHIRGGRYSGQRYFGALAEQQQIGLDSDSYGIARRRGPNHRPVRFEVPAPHTANYYDVAPDEGTQSPTAIHKSPVVARKSTKTGTVAKTAKPARGAQPAPRKAAAAPAAKTTRPAARKPRRG